MEENRNTEILDENYKYTDKVYDVEAQLNQAIEKNKMYIPAFKTSLAMTKRYTNPEIAYDPRKNMEGIYAKADPFTYMDTLEKTARLTQAQILGGWTSLIDGASSAITTGDVSKLWDNETNTDIADAMEAVEELMPHYQTQDQMDNPITWRNRGNTFKLFLPSASSMISMTVDALLTEAVFAAVGAGVGAGSTAGAGAVPGAMAGAALATLRIGKRVSQTFKNIRTLSSAIASGKSGVRAWKTGQAIKNVLPSGKLVFSSFLAANSEGGLQAKMGSEELIQSEVDKYMEIYGEPPTKAIMEKIHANAKDLEQRIYLMNTPALMATNLVQLGNIFKGTKLAKTGKRALQRTNGQLGLTKGRQARKYAWDIFESGVSEGLEEYYQGVSGTAAQEHFSIFTKDSKSYSDRFFNEASHRWKTQEGVMEFIGGATIGGMFTGVGGAFGNISSYKKYRDIANVSNSTTKNLYEQYGQNEAMTDKVVDQVKNNKINQATNTINKNIFNLAKMHHKNQTWGSMDASFDDMLNMKEDQFNEVYNTDFSLQEKNEIVGQAKSKFNAALDSFAASEERLAHNPLIRQTRFEALASKIRGNSPEVKKQEHLWSKIQDTFTEVLYNEILFGLEEASAMLNLNEDIKISSDVNGLLNFEDSSLDSWIKSKVTEAEALGGDKVIEKISKETNKSKQLNIILKEYYKLKPAQLEKAHELLLRRGMLKVVQDKAESFNDPEQLYQHAKEVSDWMEYLDANKLTEVGPVEQDVMEEKVEPVEEVKKTFQERIADIENATEIDLDLMDDKDLTTEQKKKFNEAVERRKKDVSSKTIRDKYNKAEKTPENLEALKQETLHNKEDYIKDFKEKVDKKQADEMIDKIKKSKKPEDITLEDYGKENTRVEKALKDRKDKIEKGFTQQEQVQEVREETSEISMTEMQQAYEEGLTMSAEDAFKNLLTENNNNCG